MDDIKYFIKNLDLNTKLRDEFSYVKNKNLFREKILRDLNTLLSLMDSHKDKPALVMGLGPSLLEINKDEYKNFVKITCNNFNRVPNFFDTSFKPDFWCAANSLEEVSEPLSYCVKENITSILTIPKKSELEEIIAKSLNNDKIITWLWEYRILQELLSKKYNVPETYSHCNTITNHMIAFAMWLGCNPIYITGFDLSYKQSLEEFGTTHAGYNHDSILKDDGILGLLAFDDPNEKKQIISDLKFLCKIAYKNNIKINNLSSGKNKLPYNLSYRE